MVDFKMSIFQSTGCEVQKGSQLMFKHSYVNYSGSLHWKTCKIKFTTLKKVSTKDVKRTHVSLKNCKIQLLPYGPMLYQSEFIHNKSTSGTSEVCHMLGFNFFFFCGINKISGPTANISINSVHVQRTTEIKVCALPQWKAGILYWNLG